MQLLVTSSHFLFVHCFTNTKNRNFCGSELGIEPGGEYVNRLLPSHLSLIAV